MNCKNIWIICKKELHLTLSHWLSYLILGVVSFLYMSSTNSVQNQEVKHTLLIAIMSLVAVTLATKPLIDERKDNTLSLLHSSAINTADIILGKFFYLLLFLLAIMLLSNLLPLIFYLIILQEVFREVFILFFNQLFSIMLWSSFLCSVGLFVSSISNHQGASIIITLGTLLASITFAFRNSSYPFYPLQALNAELNLLAHLSNFITGFYTPKSILYFIALTVFFLFLTIRALEVDKWSK